MVIGVVVVGFLRVFKGYREKYFVCWFDHLKNRNSFTAIQLDIVQLLISFNLFGNYSNGRFIGQLGSIQDREMNRSI